MIESTNQHNIFAIAPARLIDGTGARSVSDAAVIIEAGRIQRITSRDEAANEMRTQGGELVVRDSDTLIPGLVDAHVHLAWSSVTSKRWETWRSDPRMLTTWAFRSAQMALAAGVTTLGDCGAPAGVTLSLKRAVQEGLPTTSNLFVCGPAITTTGGHGEFIGETADSAIELRSTVRRLCRAGVDFIKVMATGGAMDPETNRRRAQYTVEELQVVVDEAHRLRRRVVAHCNATEGIRNAVAAGVDVIAHCNWLSQDEGMLDYDERVAAKMVDDGIFVDLNLEGAMAPLGSRDGIIAGLDPTDQPTNRWELLAPFRESGGKIYFTSDGFGPAIASFPTLLVQAAQSWKLTAEELIWRSTGLAAAGLGQASYFGTIEPGKQADLVVLDGDLSSEVSCLSRPSLVVRAGRIVSERGRLVLT